MSTTGRRAAEHEPIARVLPMLSVPHLDREFDYLVSAEQSDDAQPGVRVRVRFHGRLVDAFLLERRSETDHVGQLGWLDRVISGELDGAHMLAGQPLAATMVTARRRISSPPSQWI